MLLVHSRLQICTLRDKHSGSMCMSYQFKVSIWVAAGPAEQQAGHAPAVKARLAASRACGASVLTGGGAPEAAYRAPYRCRPVTHNVEPSEVGRSFKAAHQNLLLRKTNIIAPPCLSRPALYHELCRLVLSLGDALCTIKAMRHLLFTCQRHLWCMADSCRDAIQS